MRRKIAVRRRTENARFLPALSQAAFRERDNRRSSLGSFCRPWSAWQVPEAPRRVARDYRLLLVRDWPWGLARRSVPQRWRLGGRSGSRPLCLPERPCTCTSSVTLRSWLRWMLLLLSQQRGSQERLLGVSSPARLSCCRLLAAKEKSLCLRVGRFTSVKAETFCACSHVHFIF